MSYRSAVYAIEQVRCIFPELEAEVVRSELVADVEANASDRLVVDDVCVNEFDDVAVVDASLWNTTEEDVAAEDDAVSVVGEELLAKLAVSDGVDEDTLDVALLDDVAPERSDDASEKGAFDEAEEEVVRSGIELVLFVDDALENVGVEVVASGLLVALSSATTNEAPKKRLPTMTPKTETMTVLRIWISTLRPYM